MKPLLDALRSLFSAYPRVTYSSDGRCGYVRYQEAATAFDMYWEFGGGKVIAIVDIPPVESWTASTGLPLDRRNTVLDFIARRIVKDQTSSGRNRFEIGPSAITIFE